MTKAKYTSSDVQNEIITICSQQRLIRIYGNMFECWSKYNNDECQDCTSNEQLSLCISYVTTQCDRNAIRVDFIGFITCKSINGGAIAESLMIQLEECDLMIVRDQCYDGASDMAGNFNRIKQRVPVAHCIASLILAVVHRSKSQCVRTLISSVQDITFVSSKLTCAAWSLRSYLPTYTTKPIDIKNTSVREMLCKCDTRWTARSDALSTFRNVFSVVIRSLEELQDDHGRAPHFLTAILRFDFIITLVATQYTLSAPDGLVKIVQMSKNDTLLFIILDYVNIVLI
ncbi:LOW QUALITY PROTEIN: hypothetical protein MAR_013039 [Mya arenaria]|uniref:DUF4371 domain-containing protein n=1 Tax=Mya arenaria TaxID=6604 RepID=A0ABY7FYT9_MYAAR|nr:LOW QUALITY PROTEIN: hypothetical protein MAR_013039 [Mya arenaria]